jgi:hypothetical protein
VLSAIAFIDLCSHFTAHVQEFHLKPPSEGGSGIFKKIAPKGLFMSGDKVNSFRSRVPLPALA